ncbi:MAG: sugar phosphate isomerase/epimerase [Chloroflexi bacterium]|nr:sugar phosphate isomerase/epimerase [Chloroflexota bacterium]
MGIRHSVNMGLLGQQRDRFHVYTEPRSLAERLSVLHSIPGCQGIEVVYPAEFRDLEAGCQQVLASGWTVSAVNLNVKADAKWRNGSFTSMDKGIRGDAVRDLKTCMDLAAALHTDLVTCCPLIDGHNYAFQADYVAQWRWLVEGIREAASHRSDVRVSLEYKTKESRNYCTLADAGRALHLCHQVGLENVGITFDVGHALIAGEAPAATCALIEDAGRLFYTHFNDNGCDWDWDMIPGSVHVWDLLETLYYLQRVNWSGWFSYDVVTRSGDNVLGVQVATMRVMQAAEKLLAKIGMERLEAMIARGAPHESVAAHRAWGARET